MTAALFRLTPESLPATWPRIENMVGSACARSHGRYSAAHIRDYGQSGKWQIWVAIDDKGICAVAGTEIVAYDTGLKSIAVKFGTGRGRHSWQHFMEDVMAWGKSQGCTMGEGIFRKGWKKALPGWSHTHDSLERVL